MEMGWCADHGIPHSKLLKWSQEDRAKLHAYLLEDSQRCAMCGTAHYEWDPKEGGSRTAYVPQEKYCHGCYLKSAAAEGNDSLPGTTIELVSNSIELQAKIREDGLRRMKVRAEEREAEQEERQERLERQRGRLHSQPAG